MERLEAHRSFFTNLIVANTGLPAQEASRLIAAFASTPRERFVGPGPWRVFTRSGYITTPTDDPAFLYQDVSIALQEEGPINNGRPVVHAICLAAVNVKPGETIVHVGCGTGYYTALLARLTGPTGSVLAYEIEPELVRRATNNLAEFTNVTVHHQSGSAGPLPQCDIIYVNAGSTAPLDIWLDALCPGGRLLCPLTPSMPDSMTLPDVSGGVLLVTRSSNNQFEARFVCPAMWIPCVGARDPQTELELTEAFRRGDMAKVRSLRRDREPDDTCWVSGDNWWLSTCP